MVDLVRNWAPLRNEIFLLALENVAHATQSAILVQGAFRPPAALCHSHDREGSTPRSGQSSRCIVRRRRFVNTPASSASRSRALMRAKTDPHGSARVCTEGTA
jgi:hypothetical protein